MAISYPITLPSAPKPAHFTLGTVNAAAISASPFTGTQQVYKHQGEFWTAEITLPPLKRAEAADWVAAMTSLGGIYGTFKLPVYGHETPQGVGTGSPQAYGVGTHTIWSNGWTTSTTDILKAGDFLTVSDQLFQVMADANSDGSGAATLDVWPAFRNFGGGTPSITVNSPYGLFRLTGNTMNFSLNTALIYGISFTARQAF